LDPAQLERLAAEIGERILALSGRQTLTCEPCQAASARTAAASADAPCTDCQGGCAERCASKTKCVVRAGADRVSANEQVSHVDTELAGLIDHTVLKPDAVRADIEKVCAEARQYGFASVCINPYWVPLAAKLLAGSPVKVCTVVGFPLGATSTAAKVCEAEMAIRVGAQEIDMVLNVGALKSGDFLTAKSDVQGVADATHRGGAILKVIIETALLSDEEKIAACVLAKLAGADFVKTSTGFAKHGATASDVALMRKVVGAELGVKAAGGIRTLEDLRAMTEAGASRIGASASVKIVEAAAR
jgi:deoxyribose-phosphate aldolase